MTSPFDNFPDIYKIENEVNEGRKIFYEYHSKAETWRERHEEEILQAYDGARRLDAVRNLYLEQRQSRVMPGNLGVFFNRLREILEA